MKYIFAVLAIGIAVLGCARDVAAPVAPDSLAPETALAQSNHADEGPYRLWGEFVFYINSDHDQVDVVPKRNAHFPLNALKFLEDYCKDCLQIESIRNNGDGTIDLTVRITHPFNGFPQFTGFDVKGIIMFNGSYEYPKFENSEAIPVQGTSFRISWKELGDPEVLNADGYTFRWSPTYDSGSNQPIFNYWEGKYASGVPTAHINAFLNFYSSEERHMFAHDRSVTRTYHIWLPPGPVVAGYAVEACWEPPSVTPVTDPLTDFPITANQPEPYVFKIIANNGEPVTDCDECCWGCDEQRLFFRQWSEPLCNWELLRLPPPKSVGHAARISDQSRCREPEYEGWYMSRNGVSPTCPFGNGTQRFFSMIYYVDPYLEASRYAYTLFDITNDDPDLD